MLERLFHLSANNTDAKTELIAGLTTFMTMAYVLLVNPSILATAGMDRSAVLLATAIGAGLVSMAMGFYVNCPFALAPGMGLNAFFTYSLVLNTGVSWQTALGAVFLAGILFIILTVTKVRQHLVDAIPAALKNAIPVGLGFFICFIGVKLSGITAIHLSLIPATMENLRRTGGNGIPLPFETSIHMGAFAPGVLLTIFGVLLICLLLARNIKGAMLIGILTTTIIALVTGHTELPRNFVPLAIPDFSQNAFLALDIKGALNISFLAAILTFTFVALFDTMGSLLGTASKAGMLDKDGNFPQMGKAMAVDAVGISFGALLGTSPINIYVESTAGISVGGRTGLTAFIVGLLFIIAMFFTPLVYLIPDAATAPALIIVGAMMLEPIKKIKFDDVTEYIPAFVTIVAMPYTYSISNGICFGLVTYPIMKLAAGKYKEVHWIMWLLALLVVLRYAFLDY